MQVLDHFKVVETVKSRDDRYLLILDNSMIAEVYTHLDKEDGQKKARQISISCMNGCPMKCEYCGAGQLPIAYNLQAEDMLLQVDYVITDNEENEEMVEELEVTFDRQGEAFLNLASVQKAIELIREKYSNKCSLKFNISTVGLAGADYSWIDKEDIRLTISLMGLEDTDREKSREAVSEIAKIAEIQEIELPNKSKVILLNVIEPTMEDLPKYVEEFKGKFEESKFEGKYMLKYNLQWEN